MFSTLDMADEWDDEVSTELSNFIRLLCLYPAQFIMIMLASYIGRVRLRMQNLVM